MGGRNCTEKHVLANKHKASRKEDSFIGKPSCKKELDLAAKKKKKEHRFPHRRSRSEFPIDGFYLDNNSEAV
jgi:hypothetical protein